jgi:glycosyltransferase involved in cell wall biosynthesis
VLKHPRRDLPRDTALAIREAGVEDAVDVLGGVDSSLLATLYRAADVVVSVPSSDSSPATAWEALACGRPLVVSDLPWARTELHHRQDAWLTRIDAVALANALIALLGDPQLASRLGSSGRLLAATRMDRRDRLRELDAHYRRLRRPPRDA